MQLNSNNTSKGFLFLGLGKKYIDLVYNLVITLNCNGDLYPKSIVVKEEDIDYAKNLNVFDQILKFTPCELFNTCINDFEKYCTYPRMKFKDYMVYDETIITDGDMLCIYNTNSLWRWLSEQSKDIVMLGFKNDSTWHWGFWGTVCSLNQLHMPHTHGGFFYFRKNSEKVKQFFDFATYAFINYDKIHFRRNEFSSRIDEPCFAYAHAKTELNPTEFTDFPIMTFNLLGSHEIPTKLQTLKNIELSDYIPFVHMFEKLEGENYKQLLKKIIKNES